MDPGNEQLTEQEVLEVLLAFWRFDAEKAHLADSIPIMDDGWFIRAVDPDGQEILRMEGLAGLEDHQEGKMDHFDEEFVLDTFECEIDGDTATAWTTSQWHFRYRKARKSRSSQCCADLAHEWQVRRHPERGMVVMSSHTCTHFAFRPGEAPPPPSDQDAVVEASAKIHLTPPG